jgi:hypothetical protein
VADGARQERDIARVTGCGVITGNLRIYSTTVNNLDFLASLTSVEGLFEIGSIGEGNPNLTSLTGLENLTNVGSTLSIRGNNALTSLDGLQNLTNVRFGTFIEENPSLDCTPYSNFPFMPVDVFSGGGNLVNCPEQ